MFAEMVAVAVQQQQEYWTLEHRRDYLPPLLLSLILLT